MSFSDWLIIGGAALLIKHGMKKEAADSIETDSEYSRFMDDIKTNEKEWERSRAVNNKRRNMPCFFSDGLSCDDFIDIANHAGRKIKRVKSVSVRGAVIYCNVESQTGYSDWDFSVDFNDWGHVTGTYWTRTDNSDSSIPKHFGHLVSGWIHEFYRERGIYVRDWSDYVDQNKDLETDAGLNYYYRNSFFGKVFGKQYDTIQISFGTEELIGEHLYPVLSLLREVGFKNIKTFSVPDINDRNPGYIFQVEQVVISGSNYYESGMMFPDNAEVYISYHTKQTIVMPFSEGEMKRGNYITVGDRLVELGFTQIYERKIKDLSVGWLIKDGSVEQVLIDGDENKSIEKGKAYEYDQQIVICYHTKKS